MRLRGCASTATACSPLSRERLRTVEKVRAVSGIAPVAGARAQDEGASSALPALGPGAQRHSQIGRQQRVIVEGNREGEQLSTEMVSQAGREGDVDDLPVAESLCAQLGGVRVGHG